MNTLATITGKGAGFRSLDDTWVDTTTAHGRLVLGGLAKFERELIRARTGDAPWRTASGLAGKPTLTHHQRLEVIKRLKAGKETQGQFARSYNVEPMDDCQVADLVRIDRETFNDAMLE